MFYLLLFASATTPPSADESDINAWSEQMAEVSCRADQSAVELLLDKTEALTASPESTQEETGYWQAARTLGCARWVESSDGRVRIWTTKLETRTPEETVRGQGYLVWKDKQGRHHVSPGSAVPELHLDTIIDAIVPMRGSADDYLILGLRAYRTPFPGDSPRRFATRIVFHPKTGELRPIDPATRASLLLAAPAPDTGKFRHHVFASNWLTFDGLLLKMEPIPYAESRSKAAPVARWNGRLWRKRSSWAGQLLTNTW